MTRSPPLRPCLGTCPECSEVAVCRETAPGRVVGACCAGPGCWWAGEVEEEQVTALAACSEAMSLTCTDEADPRAMAPGETR